MKWLFGIVAFVGGFVAGAYASKKYYQRIADEEVESVKSAFREIEKNRRVRAHKAESHDEDIDIQEIKKARSEYADEEEELPGVVVEVISEDEAGEDDFTISSWTYYEGDNVVTDENNDVVEHPEDFIGDGYLESMAGEDEVYFRNHERKIDYEVVRDLRAWEDTPDSNYR